MNEKEGLGVMEDEPTWVIPQEQIVKHVTETRPTISVSATKNTKGYNYDASVHDAPDVETAMRLLNTAMTALANQYGRSDG